MVKKILLPLLILVFFSAIAVAMYIARPKPEKVDIEPPSFFVEVAEARKSLVNFKVESQGSVAPRTETTLIAEASGQIIEVSNAFVSGGFFKKGEGAFDATFVIPFPLETGGGSRIELTIDDVVVGFESFLGAVQFFERLTEDEVGAVTGGDGEVLDLEKLLVVVQGCFVLAGLIGGISC